ncbi:MAG TPA: hypothetical protein VM901_13600 [Bdellovibrionota bacterium]|jgi:predicted Zn-dependent protease with MMP-like domain|nr:hypothetical protein [Bdellovibrionota bacterium]
MSRRHAPILWLWTIGFLAPGLAHATKNDSRCIALMTGMPMRYYNVDANGQHREVRRDIHSKLRLTRASSPTPEIEARVRYLYDHLPQALAVIRARMIFGGGLHFDANEAELVELITKHPERSELVFLSGREHPDVFAQAGTHRAAVTGDRIEDPIYIDTDKAAELNDEAIFSMLLHETGHHYGIKDDEERSLDEWAAKITRRLNFQTLVLDDPDGTPSAIGLREFQLDLTDHLYDPWVLRMTHVNELGIGSNLYVSDGHVAHDLREAVHNHLLSRETMMTTDHSREFYLHVLAHAYHFDADGRGDLVLTVRLEEYSGRLNLRSKLLEDVYEVSIAVEKRDGVIHFVPDEAPRTLYQKSYVQDRVSTRWLRAELGVPAYDKEFVLENTEIDVSAGHYRIRAEIERQLGFDNRRNLRAIWVKPVEVGGQTYHVPLSPLDAEARVRWSGPDWPEEGHQNGHWIVEADGSAAGLEGAKFYGFLLGYQIIHSETYVTIQGHPAARADETHGVRATLANSADMDSRRPEMLFTTGRTWDLDPEDVIAVIPHFKNSSFNMSIVDASLFPAEFFRDLTLERSTPEGEFALSFAALQKEGRNFGLSQWIGRIHFTGFTFVRRDLSRVTLDFEKPEAFHYRWQGM